MNTTSLEPTVTLELTRSQLFALIDMEEEFLCLLKNWKVGDPHPLGPDCEAASDKIRDAYADSVGVYLRRIP